MAGLASWMILGRSGSASQAATARSSASSSAVGSNQAAGPSPVATAMPVSSPVPRPKRPVTATPTGAAPACVPSQPATSPAPSISPVQVEAGLGLGLDGVEVRIQPLAQHPELERVEDLVHGLAVPARAT